MIAAAFLGLAILLLAGLVALSAYVAWDGGRMSGGTDIANMLSAAWWALSVGISVAVNTAIVLGIVAIADRSVRRGLRRGRALTVAVLILSPMVFLACSVITVILGT